MPGGLRAAGPARRPGEPPPAGLPPASCSPGGALPSAPAHPATAATTHAGNTACLRLRARAPAAGTAHRGRPALDRSDHTGMAGPGDGSGADRTTVHPADLPTDV